MARLRYVSSDQPGYTRHQEGEGFIYYDAEGNTIEDEDLRAWIESIVIPPAWTDVWISPHKNGHILATGRDSKGRKQYRYHPDWRDRRNKKKFSALQEFGRALPQIREVTDQHLRMKDLAREKVLAAVVRLLETTMIRIGNEEYMRKNDSYGLTTFTDDHVAINGSTMTFDFVGKSGKEHNLALKDRRLARIVKNCRDLPGYALFQYHDEQGEQRVVGSSDVNDYLQEITGREFTAKVFRTWGGSVLAIKYLCGEPADPETRTDMKGCIAHVSQSLGNTKAICRDYYIHPSISRAFEEGSLCAIYAEQIDQPRGVHDLSAEEDTLMALIEQGK